MALRVTPVTIRSRSSVGRRQASRWLIGGIVAITLGAGIPRTRVAAQEPKSEGDDGATPEGTPLPAIAPSVPTATPEQLMLNYANEVLVENFRPLEGQPPSREVHTTDVRTNTLLRYKAPGDQAVNLAHSVDPAGTLRFLATEIREANIHNARDHITADAIYGTLAKYFLPLPEPFTTAVWKQYRKQDGAPTIERAWDNEDGSVETVAAALWGQNAPNGPGNYLVIRARLFPGSPHHAARTIFTS